MSSPTVSRLPRVNVREIAAGTRVLKSLERNSHMLPGTLLSGQFARLFARPNLAPPFLKPLGLFCPSSLLGK